MTEFTIINTNARSLRPKVESMLDCFSETNAGLAILTETWLQDGRVEEMVDDLSRGSGLGFLARNRRAAANGFAYGGVALVWRESMGKFREVKIKNPNGFEVLAAAGSMRGHRRKVVVVACYIPPNYNRQKGAEALEFIEEVVLEMKSRFKDPYVTVAGDFNQWRAEDALANFSDVREVEVGATRGSRKIDRIFVNFSRLVTESGTLSPLETEETNGLVRRSDHRVAYVRLRIPKKEAFRWEVYSYRHFNDDLVAAFREWVVWHDWDEVLSASSSDAKAEAYQGTVVGAVERFCPLKKRKKKSTDPPWLDKKTKGLIEDRKKLFVDEGGRTDC